MAVISLSLVVRNGWNHRRVLFVWEMIEVRLPMRLFEHMVGRCPDVGFVVSEPL